MAQLLDFLPADLKARIAVEMVQAVKDSAPSSIESNSAPAAVAVVNNENANGAQQGGEEEMREKSAAAQNEPAAVANNESPTNRNNSNGNVATESPFILFTGDDALGHVLLPGDRLVVKSDVNSLRSMRTLLGLGWVGISETAFHSGLDIIAHSSGKATEEETQKAQEEKDAVEGKPIVSETEPAAAVAAKPDETEHGLSKKSPLVFLESRALYRIKESAEGLHSFLPVDRDEMKRIKFAIVVISHNNTAVGHRLDDRLFVETFRVSVVSCVRVADNASLFGRELSLHILQPGDALLVRLRPSAATIFANTANLHEAFYDVEGLEGVNPSDKLLNNHYFIIPSWLGCCFPNWGEPVTTHGGGSQRAVLAPSWFRNITIVIFLGIIIAASLNVDLAAASGVGVCLYVILGIMTPGEAIHVIDWHLIIGIALSFGLGTAMTNSKLGPYVGYKIATSGLTGFPMIVVSCFITSIFAGIVSNKGSVSLLFPVITPMMKSLGLPPKAGAIVLANCCVAGFFSIVGCPSHMVIFAPGRFRQIDFFLYGFPVFVVYTILTAVFVALEYGVI